MLNIWENEWISKWWEKGIIPINGRGDGTKGRRLLAITVFKRIPSMYTEEFAVPWVSDQYNKCGG